jgi:hypothetical protein
MMAESVAAGDAVTSVVTHVTAPDGPSPRAIHAREAQAIDRHPGHPRQPAAGIRRSHHVSVSQRCVQVPIVARRVEELPCAEGALPDHERQRMDDAPIGGIAWPSGLGHSGFDPREPGFDLRQPVVDRGRVTAQ